MSHQKRRTYLNSQHHVLFYAAHAKTTRTYGLVESLFLYYFSESLKLFLTCPTPNCQLKTLQHQKFSEQQKGGALTAASTLSLLAPYVL